jgi:peptidoglycan hydrolase-like protein with peptidoglycan-binding domain
MLKRRIPALAITGITIAAALATLGATGASAATMAASAPGHVAAPPQAAQAADDPSGCVTETYTEALNHGYVQCVVDAQVLFNDLYYYEGQHPNHVDHVYLGVNQLLVTDGSYGPDTADVVKFFQGTWGLTPADGKLRPNTWDKLCNLDWLHGYRGVYWHAVGCATEPGL